MFFWWLYAEQRHAVTPNYRCCYDPANDTEKQPAWRVVVRIDKVSRILIEQVGKGQTHGAHHLQLLLPEWQNDPLSASAGPSYAWLLVTTLVGSMWLWGKSTPWNMLDQMKMETVMLSGWSGGMGNGLENSLHETKISWRETGNFLWKGQISFKALMT